MFVAKDFVRDCFVAQIPIYAPKCACAPEFAHICARKRRRAKSLATNIGTIPKNMSTNFQLKRLKLILSIVEKPENRVHKLTDSNVSPVERQIGALFGHCSSCGFSSSFASLGRFYEFERSPLCAGTGVDPKGHAGDTD